MNHRDFLAHRLWGKPGAVPFILVLIFTGLLVRTSHAQNCVTPPVGLVSWWAGEGNAADSFGTNNGIVMNKAGFAKGMVGQAFTFNGVNQYIQIPNNPSLTPTGSFSIEAWIFVTEDTASSSGEAILSKWGDDQRSYAFTRTYNYELLFAISDAAHESDEKFHGFTTPADVLTPDKWQHVAAVYDQATGTRSIYVDGEKVASRTDPPLVIFNGSSLVGIGAHAWTVGSRSESYFNGQIDEVSFYKVALTPAQIQAIFRAGPSGKCR